VQLKQTSNPTYLRTLLEELRLHGVYEELEKRIDFYARARNPVELYERILCRLETVSNVQLENILEMNVASVVYAMHCVDYRSNIHLQYIPI
jgi:hypothetical protein